MVIWITLFGVFYNLNEAGLSQWAGRNFIEIDREKGYMFQNGSFLPLA